MAGFAAEIDAGVTPERLKEIDDRKEWLNEHIPSFKVSPLPLLFKLPYTTTQRKGEILFSF